MAFIGIYTLKKQQEMHDLKCILAAWYTFGRRKQKIQCIPSFPLKPIRRYLISLSHLIELLKLYIKPLSIFHILLSF
jgi:hypothetical protein